MLISDADRQSAVEELGRHFAAGRLDLDEYSGRVEEVLAAETLADLDHARRDLPFMRIAPASERRSLDRLGRSATGGAARRGRRLGSRLVLLITALVLIAGVVLALSAQVVGMVLLVVGWLLGVAQGPAGRPPT